MRSVSGWQRALRSRRREKQYHCAIKPFIIPELVQSIPIRPKKIDGECPRYDWGTGFQPARHEMKRSRSKGSLKNNGNLTPQNVKLFLNEP